MIAEMFVLSDVIDNHGPAAITNFVADRRLNVELASRQESEGNFVTNGASDPTIPRHSRHSRKTHSGGAADDFQNGRNGVDPAKLRLRRPSRPHRSLRQTKGLSRSCPGPRSPKSLQGQSSSSILNGDRGRGAASFDRAAQRAIADDFRTRRGKTPKPNFMQLVYAARSQPALACRASEKRRRAPAAALARSPNSIPK